MTARFIDRDAIIVFILDGYARRLIPAILEYYCDNLGVVARITRRDDVVGIGFWVGR